MDNFIESKNKDGIMNEYVSNRYDINSLKLQYFYNTVEKDLKNYILKLLEIKCAENNQFDNNYALNVKDIINQNLPLKLKKDKMNIVLLQNCMGAYFPDKDVIEVYTTVFHKMLKYFPTHDVELYLIKVMYHEMQHQLQLNQYNNELFKSEVKLLEQHTKFYYKYHNYFETEIDAEEKSLLRLVNDIESGFYPIFESDLTKIKELQELQKEKRKTLEYMEVKDKLKTIK